MARDPWKKKRKSNYLYTRKSFYIFCEGTESEIYYLNKFKELIEQNPQYNRLVLIEPVGIGKGTTNVVNYGAKYIKNKGIDNGEIYFLYDKDSFKEKDFDSANKKINELNKANKNESLHYYASWSNECFELWYLLHFSRYESNNGRDDYFKRLNSLLKSHKLGNYNKTRNDMFDFVLNNGNPKLAIKYAEDLDKRFKDKTPSNSAPCTKVHMLVKELAKYLNEDKRTKFL